MNKTDFPRIEKFTESNALYARALDLIPGASQTFSKSAMAMVKGAAPLFLDRGEGCRVQDIDGNWYIDYVMGLLPNVLGYRDMDVDAAIQAQLERGISFSLATKLEVELAERLTRIIPCAEMVRYGKNGSDATSAAVRLARAATGRDRIACCGYHGWHDWYIGTTTRNLGVPKAVAELTTSFPYNQAERLEDLLQADPNGFAGVILEATEFTPPDAGFLERLRELTERFGVVLIFDEIITGFRLNMGGAQAHYGVTPDLASFGKSMGNGMPISAIVGRSEFMRFTDEIFFSGTFGGEALSLAASIATIDKLEGVRALTRMHRFGRRVKQGVANLLREHQLDSYYDVVGGDWWPRVQPRADGPVPVVILTSLLRQEVIANGLLFCASFNLSLAHCNDGVLEETLIAWQRAAGALAEALTCADPSSFLRGAPVRPVFQPRR